MDKPKSLVKDLFRRVNKRAIAFPVLMLLIVVVTEIVSTTYLPEARKPLYDALGNFDHALFIYGLLLYCGVYFLLTSAQGVKTWIEQKIALQVREALMKTIKKDWVHRGSSPSLLNPCSRLNDDAKAAAEGAITVGVELFISAFIVIGLIVGMTSQPKLLVAALIYSAISIGLALFFRRPLMASRYNNLTAEGQHRISLTLISVGQGDFTSKSKWQNVKETYTSYIGVMRNYKYFGALQTAILIGAPFLIMAPEFFAHAVTLGDVMKGVSAFDLLVVNAAVWVQLYPSITDVQVGFKRVNEMYQDVQSR